MRRLATFGLILLFAFPLSACDTGDNYAPVTDIGSFEAMPKTGIHRVKNGESLYEVAWRYGLDYRDLAARNHIAAPYTIQAGQMIALRANTRVEQQTITSTMIARDAVEQTTFQLVLSEDNTANKTVVDAAPVKTKPSAASVDPIVKPITRSIATIEPEPEPTYSASGWVWPAKGPVVKNFSRMNKGINIAGQLGAPIYAAQSGKIVYCGDGLRGYGNLIIIKHNSSYLSAYAHNRLILVKEGQWVKAGQKIAEMGDSGANRAMLHFEIRQAGKPINPRSIL